MRSRFTPPMAWACITIFVLAYNFTSPPGGTLSEAADGWIRRHPVLVRLAVLLLAAHIANLLPRRVDVIHRFFTIRRHK